MLRLDLFTCDRPTFERWASALRGRDAITRGNLEIGLPSFATLPGLSPVDLGLLAAALRGDPIDAALAGAAGVLGPTTPPVEPPGGALVAILRDDIVRLLGEHPDVADPAIVEAWAALADAFHGVPDSQDFLSPAAARELAAVCAHACEAATGLYVHGYVDLYQ